MIEALELSRCEATGNIMENRDSTIRRVRRYLFYFPSVYYGLAGGLFERGDLEDALHKCFSAISYGYSDEFQKMMQIEFFNLGVKCCKGLNSTDLLDDLIVCANANGMDIEKSEYYRELKG